MALFDNIGNFLFPNNGNLSNEEEQKEEKKHQNQYLEMMYMYQRYYGVVETKKYVLQGSILSCQYGTKLSKLDCLEDHGVYSGGNPVMTISDCADSNIHSFGSCLCPEKNYEGRLPMTVAQDSKGTPAKKAPGNNYAHICVPVINKNSVWHQVDSKVLIELKQKGYAPILLESAVLVCQYGGVICVKEVVNTSKTQAISDKYFAKERVKIRVTANGQQVDGKRIFAKGAIVKVHPSKEMKKVDGSDSTWIKVYYDGSNVAWVSRENLEELPQPVNNYKFQYNWDKSQYVTQDFKDKAVGVAKTLGLDPDDLMSVMAFESGLNPAQKNMAGGSATGLVQFMPMVAEELNTTTSELARMSGVDQLDYVFGYLYSDKGKMITLADIYMKVLCPEAIGKNESYPIYSSGSIQYKANKGLDSDNDGIITKKEAVQAVIDKRREFE